MEQAAPAPQNRALTLEMQLMPIYSVLVCLYLLVLPYRCQASPSPHPTPPPLLLEHESHGVQEMEARREPQILKLSF